MVYPEDCVDCMVIGGGDVCYNLNIDNDCPCGLCIVKMICENFCYVWDEWYDIKSNTAHIEGFTDGFKKWKIHVNNV